MVKVFVAIKRRLRPGDKCQVDIEIGAASKIVPAEDIEKMEDQLILY